MNRLKKRQYKKQREEQTIIDVLLTVFKGSMLGIIISIILFLVMAVIINIAGLKETVIPVSNQAIKIFSIVVAAAYAARKSKDKGWLKGSAVGVMYILFAVIIMSFFDVSVSFDRMLWSNLILGIITGAIGGMIGINIR